MNAPLTLRTGFSVFSLVAAAGPSAAQVYVNTPSQIPATGSYTENIDFDDADKDGDWDAAVADGGDQGNDQNRFWVNRGGLQAGPIGFFQDETSTRLPVVSTTGRDIEFLDFDSDGDEDIYTSNTSQVSNQSNRWWTNKGGKQLGTLGFYQEETALRWVGLGAAGSSVAPSAVLGSGGFIDWSCDCDFGDLDNDGDIDLVHSTYGGSFAGSVPTRLFLNDGDGKFSEFNPSGFQLSGTTIATGNPGIWAQGTQQNETTNTTGANCDVAGMPLDVDVGDIDGDLDLDILHGSRNTAPRMFKNRLEENGGSTLGFRDVTGAAGSGTFPTGYWTGGDNYEQEIGDMDRDGDLDVYGLNWPGLSDAVFNNTGSGTFNGMQTLASSGGDDNEGDFVDYDNDGDMDLFIAAFSAANRLYRNDYAGGGPGTFSYTFLASGTSGLSTGENSLDADGADVDNDGDIDVLSSEDQGQNENLYINTLTANDVSAPYFGASTTIASGSATGGNHVARALVYDNQPYYIAWYQPTKLEITVGGIRIPDIAAQSSQGQVFRALIPKNLFGTVNWNFRTTDQYGNTSTSSVKSFTSSGGPVGTSYGTTSGGTGGTPAVQALSLPIAGSPLYLSGSCGTSGVVGALAISSTQSAPAINLGSGLQCNLGFPILVLIIGTTDTSGRLTRFVNIPAGLGGTPINTQFFSANGTAGNVWASSQGLAFTVQ
jgi:hypothetical protein